MKSRKSATGTCENETEIRKGNAIVIVTATATEKGKRTETVITTETATGSAIGTETATETANVNENATVIVIVTVTGIANEIATRTETVVLGTTAGTKMAARATTDVTANGTGKVTRHETVVTVTEIDTRHGYQVLDGRIGNDALGRRRKIVAVTTNHETSGSQKMRSASRKCATFLCEIRPTYSDTHPESEVRHGDSFQGPQSTR